MNLHLQSLEYKLIKGQLVNWQGERVAGLVVGQGQLVD